jgi:hypothetical protein
VDLFAGVFADRWNSKILIFVGDLMQALTVLVLIIFYWIGNVVIWQGCSRLQREV